MCRALALLDALTLASLDPMPLPVAYHAAAHELARRGYDAHAIRRAIGMLAMLGTAQGNEWIDAEDREAIEELLPMAPAGQWEAHSAWVWTTEGHEIAEGF